VLEACGEYKVRGKRQHGDRGRYRGEQLDVQFIEAEFIHGSQGSR
jgi:hypothetical protein